MASELRRNVFKYYIEKATSPAGFKKILRDPAVLLRSVRTLTANRNMRTVPVDERLRDAEDSVRALGRLAGPPSTEWPTTASPDITELGEYFEKHGSDKSTHHDYHEVYGSLLDRRKPLRILEIGLGTNNLAFQSNMGLGGRPGASLRAFRDWAPQAEIQGADVDRGILFQEERIKTYFVDQTDSSSLRALSNQVGSGFDLIIDDGLHLPHANFNTIEVLFPLLKVGGTMVIEDIEAEHLHYWEAAAGILNNTHLLDRRGGYLFLITNKG